MSRVLRALSVGLWSMQQAWQVWPQPVHVHVLGALVCDAKPSCRAPGCA